MAPLKVLIVGGGITGPALGFWLSKIDCDVTIVERSPDLRASGQQIDIRGQGVTVMHRMGIEPAVRAKVVDEGGVRFLDEQGNVKALFEANKTGQGRQSFTSEFEIMRGDLVRILYGVTKDTCRYVFGTSVEGFEQRGDGVHVRFSDGAEGDFDLVVGADGQGSRTRRRMLGPDAEDKFCWLGLYFSYFTVPKTDRDEKYATTLLLPRRRVVSTRVDNPKTTQVYLGVLDPSAEFKEMEEAMKAGDVKKQKAIYADLFKDVGWEVPRLLDGMLNSPEADDFYNQKIGQVKMDRWSKGRVVVLGDAAYCPSPMTGKGTSCGLLGAYVLAGEISKHLGGDAADRGQAVDAAVASYEAVLRPVIEKVQKLPPGVPGLVYSEGPWGVWLRNWIFSWMAWLRIDKLVQRFSSDDFAGGWKLPDYPGLKYEPGNRTA